MFKTLKTKSYIPGYVPPLPEPDAKQDSAATPPPPTETQQQDVGGTGEKSSGGAADSSSQPGASESTSATTTAAGDANTTQTVSLFSLYKSELRFFSFEFKILLSPHKSGDKMVAFIILEGCMFVLVVGLYRAKKGWCFKSIRYW